MLQFGVRGVDTSTRNLIVSTPTETVMVESKILCDAQSNCYSTTGVVPLGRVCTAPQCIYP